MKIHHLNLCTMCPFGGRLVSGGPTPVWGKAELVCHALLIETAKDGLVLVDTGVGLDDVRHPLSRLGLGFVAMAAPQLGEEHTALRQVERLGFEREDVRHIVCTHLDVDHAGGLPDFPAAKIHVHRKEHDAVMARATFKERERYKKVHFAHHPKWELHEEGGDEWYGLKSLQAVSEDILMVPLPGHTRGHCAVIVRATEVPGPDWLAHCGDAYFFHLEKDDPACCPPALQQFQKRMAIDDAARRANAKRLREVHRAQGSKVRLFCAHDPHEYRALAETERNRSGKLPD